MTAPSISNEELQANRLQPVEQSHRRQKRRELLLPFGFSLLIILAILGIVLILPSARQVGLVADFMTTIIFLCPAMLCLFAFVIISVAIVGGMNRVDKFMKSPLRRMEDLTFRISQRADELEAKVQSQVTKIEQRIEPIEDKLKTFQDPNTIQSSKNGKELTDGD